MPHIKLECTSNILEKLDHHVFFKKCHELIVPIIGAQIENCQSSFILHQAYHVGLGTQTEGFIFLDIGFLEGRTEEQKNRLKEALKILLQETFEKSIKAIKVQVRLKFTLFNRDDYFKVN
jgi:5-carboxymethyl-2-hydroxymuconate isomerase